MPPEAANRAEKIENLYAKVKQILDIINKEGLDNLNGRYQCLNSERLNFENSNLKERDESLLGVFKKWIS